jgi:hypothetical protein
MNNPESLSTQLFVWLVVIVLSLGLGQVSMGVFFGYWSPTTWMIALSIIGVSFVPAIDDGMDDDAVAVI